MISTESLTSAWIDQIAEKYHYPDKPLLEKSVRALYLLEALVKEGCPLTFKGGSSLLLLLKDSLHRLSIDVDIICPPGTAIEKYLNKVSSHGFTRVVPAGNAQPRNNLPVSHPKYILKLNIKPTPARDSSNWMSFMRIIHILIPYSFQLNIGY